MQTAIESWLSDPAIAESDKREIRDLQSRGAEKELADRFYRELEFGTGGLRGILGAGTNRMNVYTVGAAAQGLANYIARQGDAARKAGVAIAFDCRRFSDVFARRVACVMAANGITAHLFEALRPTPELSFAIRRLGCISGVVITASHNPPEYNGFKCYWSDGGQVTPPHDEAIIEEVRKVGGFANVRLAVFDEARKTGLIRMIGHDIDRAFLEAVRGSCLNPTACREQGRQLKIVYTALHGTGGVLVPEALQSRGFEHVIEVPEQAVYDGNFPTVKSPNPEEAEALTLAISLARRENADLVIGTDPDADRVGIAVRKPDGAFVLLSGNQTAALLTWYLCEQHRRNGTFPKNAVVLTTIVTSDLLKEIARSYGAEVVEVLTGFKWIAEKIRSYELSGTPGHPVRQYLFGAEESYGYMPCTFTRDKDAITGTAFIAEMAAAAAAEGRSLFMVLEELYRQYGYFQEGARGLTMPGRDGSQRISALMERLRTTPPKTIGNQAVAAWSDLKTLERRATTSGAVIDRWDLPTSNVIILHLADGTKVIARPSGTEPKIKFYILVREPATDLESARASAARKIDAISNDLNAIAEAV